MGKLRGIIFAIFIFLLFIYGCSSQKDHANQEAQIEASSYAINSALTWQGFTVKKEVSCIDKASGKTYTGYMAVNSNEKPLLVLQGTSYCMGYQMGYLMPEGTARMSKDYKKVVAEALLKIQYEDAPWLFNFLQEQTLLLCRDELKKGSIPGYLIEEMQGVADGATAAGFSVSFDDVLLLNEGFDATYSILFTGALPSLTLLKEQLYSNMQRLKAQGRQDIVSKIESSISVSDGKAFFPSARPDFMGCNEFVVSGNATTDGKVFHGRDFMFFPGLYDEENNRYMYPDASVMAIYLPEEGLPFVTATAAGFVGHPTALNNRGLSMGVDVVQAGCTRATPGLGSLLVLRDIVQHCGTIGDALARMESQDRGVSWLYVIADDNSSGTFTNGVVVEEGMSSPDFSGADILPVWEQLLLWPLIMLLDDDTPDKGIMLRTQDWIFPDAFKNSNFYVQSEDGKHYYGIYFPDQAETRPDVVLATNHYVIPRMALTTFSPWINYYSSAVLPASTMRYSLLNGLVEQDYGRIDFEKARELIDFLNPNRKDSQGNNRYHYKIHGPIEGHHAIIDNKARTIEALFGYYSDWSKGERDYWARINLEQFLSQTHRLSHKDP
jgi:hypothetical protein